MLLVGMVLLVRLLNQQWDVMLGALCGFQRAEDILLPCGHRGYHCTQSLRRGPGLYAALQQASLICLRCYERAGPCIYILCMVLPMSVSRAFFPLQ